MTLILGLTNDGLLRIMARKAITRFGDLSGISFLVKLTVFLTVL